MKQVEYCVSKVEGEAALYGAAYLALRSLIKRTIQKESIL